MFSLGVFLDLRAEPSIFIGFKSKYYFFSFAAEAALNCYTSADDMSIKEECGMQTGCIKKFYKKTQKVVERGCFLVPAKEECFTEEKTGLGVCYCTSDLCNTSPARLTGFGLMLPFLTSMVYLI